MKNFKYKPGIYENYFTGRITKLVRYYKEGNRYWATLQFLNDLDFGKTYFDIQVKNLGFFLRGYKKRN